MGLIGVKMERRYHFALASLMHLLFVQFRQHILAWIHLFESFPVNDFML
jgi:hypothetical protein